VNSARLPAHVCIARHGETDWNVAGILQGWLDVRINDQGRRQAYELVAALGQANFSLVCSSAPGSSPTQSNAVQK
jgi:broad specificity phosphatase PhoE